MNEFKFKIDGTEYAAKVEAQDDNQIQVVLNGKVFYVETENTPSRPVSIPKVTNSAVAAPAAAPTASASNKLTAPLPGSITKILAKEGDKLKKGDVVMTMEAMKMENNITVECDCTLKAIKAQVGQSVNQGDVLAELECVATPKTVAAPVATPQPAPAPVAPKAALAPAGSKAVTAPLPGTVTAVKVVVGQAVKKGDTVVVMEAMKMENNIVSDWDGTISAVNVQQGASVNVGDALVVIG